MTGPRDPDLLVHAFVDEGPAELSDRSLTAIRDGIHTTRQRAARRPWRDIHMPRSILLIAPLGALLLVAGALLIGGGGGPSPVATPSPTISAAPSTAIATATATASPTATPGPTPYPLADGEAWIVLGGDVATMVSENGTGRHDLLGGLGVHINDPTWSPDGHQLAFDGNGDAGSQIWVANADGTDAHAVTASDGCPEATCTEGINPAWSPDGHSIAYIAPTHVANDFTENALMILDVATGESTPIYTTTDAHLARPTWSPDGRSIALEIDREVAGRIASTVIAVIDLDGADQTPKEITDPGLLAGYPTWHPTEDLIVFRTNRLDNNTQTMLDVTVSSDLYTMRSDGSRVTRLTDNPVGGAIIRAPSWTPDGHILFSKLAAVGSDEVLRVIAADGTGEASATGDIETSGEGRWRPGS